MKPALSLFFIVLVLAQSFSKWLIVLDYQINQEFISKNLCINKAKPSSHCKGRCQLAKKMAEEEKPASGSKAVWKQDLSGSYLQQSLLPDLTVKTEMRIAHKDRYTCRAVNTPAFPVFHPPSCS